MLYGMTYDQFWYGDPFMLRAYRQKHKLEIEEQNHALWLQGVYFLDALNTSLSNAFGKSQSKAQYTKPLQIFELTEEEKQAKLEAEMRDNYEKMKQLALAQNAKNKKEKENG